MLRRPPQGFTLVELVVSMVIVTILAAVAIPRFMGRQGFDTRGLDDQAQAMVRYAQKTAIGKRRNVYVAIGASPNNIQVCYDAACTSPVIDPVSGAAMSAQAPSGVTISPATSFSFNGLGQPSIVSNLTLTVTGDGARSFTIQRETGYVSVP